MSYTTKDFLNIVKDSSLNYTYMEMLEMETIEDRRLYIDAEIDGTVLNSVSFHITRYNRQDRGIPIEKRDPVIIYLNTPGGSATDGFGIIDIIMESKTPVYTVNQGVCYSMGLCIFLAGSKRYAMKNSTFLLHDGSAMVIGSTNKMKDRFNFISGQMEDKMKEYIVDRTSITEEQYDNNLRREWYFYPEEGKQLGVVTHIVGSDCDFDEII